MKKVNYAEYEGKYEESIKERLEKNPESIDVETMRANLYGYTFTEEYAKRKIPDELSMDYWSERQNKEIKIVKLEDLIKEDDQTSDVLELDELSSEDDELSDIPELEDLIKEDDEMFDEQEFEKFISKDDELSDDKDHYYFRITPQERLILEAIDSTGDGKTPETALSVIDVSQEYEYIERVNRLRFMDLAGQKLENGIDCLDLRDFLGNIVKVYFDISRRFEVGYPKYTFD